MTEPTMTSIPFAANQIVPTRRTGGWLLGGAVLATGLIAGTYYAYACSVMPGLAATDDRTFVSAMQRINVAIQNPVFFASFFGAFLLTGIAYLRLRKSANPVARWVLGALALYTVSLVTTMAVNVPLNDQLAAGDPADPAAVRAAFEGPWVIWNVVRTLLATAALACLARALYRNGRPTVA